MGTIQMNLFVFGPIIPLPSILLTSIFQDESPSACRAPRHGGAERSERTGSALCRRVSQMYLLHSSCLNVCEIDLLGVMMCSVRANESDAPKRSLVCLCNVRRKMNEGCFTVFSRSHASIHAKC